MKKNEIHCPDCGGTDVVTTAWVQANSGKIDYSTPLFDRFGCNDCKDYEFKSLCDCSHPDRHSAETLADA